MDNNYFKEALSNMVTNAAYKDAIKHMYDSGLTVDEIHNQLDYPVSVEQIKSVISDYENKRASDDVGYEYIERYDAFGKKSYIRIRKDLREQ